MTQLGCDESLRSFDHSVLAVSALQSFSQRPKRAFVFK
jgi:hypothetical protein